MKSLNKVMHEKVKFLSRVSFHTDKNNYWWAEIKFHRREN